MATYYVKANGSNAANGTSDGTAWQTLDYALTQYAAGDTVLVRKGDVISAPNKGFTVAKSGVTLGSYDGGNGEANPIFDGEQTGTLSYSGIITVSATNVTVDGISVANANRRGIYVTDNSNGTILRNCVSDWSYYSGIQASFCDNVLIENCTAKDAAQKRFFVPTGGWPTCMSIFTCTNSIVRGCTILGGHGEGIVFGRGCTYCIIEDNYIMGCRAMGIYFGASSNCIARRNILVESSDDINGDGYAGGAAISMNNENSVYEKGFALTVNCHDNQVYDNLIARYVHGFSFLDQNKEASDYRNIYVYNNIVVDCQVGMYDQVSNATVRAGGIEIKNNIFINNTEQFAGSRTSNIIADYNAWTASPGAYTGPNDVINAITLPRTTGWGDYNVPTIPAADFVPIDNSANYGSGVDVGLATDYYGNAYSAPFDIGPFSANTEVPNPELPSEIITLAFRSAGATVSNLVAANVQHTEASAYITTSSATGDIFAVVTESATPPSAADIEAGTGISADTLTIAVAGQQGPLLFTGLPLDTDLWVHAVQDTGSYSSVLTTAFRTLKPTLYNAGIDIDPTTKVGTLVVESDYPVGTTVYAAWYSGVETDKTALEVINGTAGALGSANVPANNENVFTVPAQADNELFYAKFVQQVD